MKVKGGIILKQDTLSAQDFLNVLDIRNDVLYTADGYLVAYILIHPYNKDLLSKRELVKKTNILTGELSQEQKPWKFLAVSKPVDVAPLLAENNELLTSSDDEMQKKLLRMENSFMATMATSGDISERQFYLMCWEQQSEMEAADIKKRKQDMINHFASIGVTAELMKKPDIIRLANLIHNPAYILDEDVDISPVFPVLED